MLFWQQILAQREVRVHSNKQKIKFLNYLPAVWWKLCWCKESAGSLYGTGRVFALHDCHAVNLGQNV